MEFKNATVVKKANIYFDGKVTSRTIFTDSGERKSLGIFLPGEYDFNTGAAEIMEVLGGEASVKVSGEEEFSLYKEGDSFKVPANSSFKIEVKSVLDYCCSYAD